MVWCAFKRKKTTKHNILWFFSNQPQAKKPWSRCPALLCRLFPVFFIFLKTTIYSGVKYFPLTAIVVFVFLLSILCCSLYQIQVCVILSYYVMIQVNTNVFIVFRYERSSLFYRYCSCFSHSIFPNVFGLICSERSL